MVDAVPKITLRQLTYFLAAAGEQSVTRAAQKLNVSPPSISAGITQIEEALGIRLFTRRHARGLVLTPAGNDLAADARSILLHASEIEKISERSEKWETGRLNIGCLATLAPYLVPLILREIGISHPLLDVRWREGTHETLLEALNSGAIDVALLYNYDLPTTVEATLLRLMPLQVVLPAGHALSEKRACRLADIVGEPFILLDQPRTRDYFLSHFKARGLEPQIAHNCSSFEMTRSLVANGFGYTLLNFCPPYGFPGHGTIVSRPLQDSDRTMELVLARLYRFRLPQALKATQASIEAALGELPISC